MKKRIIYSACTILLLALIYLVYTNFIHKNNTAQITHYPIKTDKDKRWGFIDLKGNIIIDNEWESTPSIAYNGITLVQNKDGLYEYYLVGAKPQKIGEEYKTATLFCDEVALVSKENCPIMLIDKNGREIKTIKEINGKLVDECRQYNEGYAAYKNEEGLWGYINKKGESVIDAKFNTANDFNEGRAKVTITEKDKNKVAFIDANGNFVIQPTDAMDFSDKFSDNLIGYTDNGSEWGFLNSVSEKIIKPIKDFKKVGEFENGFATFYDGDKYGIINKKGEIIVRAKYQDINISDGLFLIKDNDKMGLINNKSEEIIKPDFEFAQFLGNGNVVAVDGKKIILLGRDGKEINKSSFEDIRIYNNLNSAYSDYFDGTTAAEKILSGLTYGQIKGINKNSNIIDLIKTFELDKTEYRPSKNEVVTYDFNVNEEQKSKWEAKRVQDSIEAATRMADSLAALEASMMPDDTSKIITDNYPYINGNSSYIEKTKYYGRDIECTYEFQFASVIKTPIKETYYVQYGWSSYPQQRTVGYSIDKATKIIALGISINLTGKGSGKCKLILTQVKEKVEKIGYKITEKNKEEYDLLNKENKVIGGINQKNNSNLVLWFYAE